MAGKRVSHLRPIDGMGAERHGLRPNLATDYPGDVQECQSVVRCTGHRSIPRISSPTRSCRGVVIVLQNVDASCGAGHSPNSSPIHRSPYLALQLRATVLPQSRGRFQGLHAGTLVEHESPDLRPSIYLASVSYLPQVSPRRSMEAVPQRA